VEEQRNGFGDRATLLTVPLQTGFGDENFVAKWATGEAAARARLGWLFADGQRELHPHTGLQVQQARAGVGKWLLAKRTGKVD
jgi:hypothetical protein